MLTGSTLTLQIFSPNQETLIARTANATISDLEPEFDNVAFFDLNGGAFFVVAAEIDVTQTVVDYRTLQSGRFSDVDDESGFNGYKMIFRDLGGDGPVTLRDARLIDDYNTLEIPEDRIETTDRALWVNVDGLSFSNGDGMRIQLDLKYQGDAGRDLFTGSTGKDLILGAKGRDVLNGGAGNDTIKGGNGADLISGGSGRDTLKGGAGADTFVLDGSRGRDLVRDFEVDVDMIAVSDRADSFDALTLTQTDDGVLIDAGRSVMLLQGVGIDALSDDHFIF